MGIITKMRKQTAIYWTATGKDGRGARTFAAPVEVDCRWDEVSDIFQTQEEQDLVSNAVVYPDRDMSVGDYLKLGELDSTTPSNPTMDDDAYPIRKWEKIRKLRQEIYLRIATL